MYCVVFAVLVASGIVFSMSGGEGVVACACVPRGEGVVAWSCMGVVCSVPRGEGVVACACTGVVCSVPRGEGVVAWYDVVLVAEV